MIAVALLAAALENKGKQYPMILKLVPTREKQHFLHDADDNDPRSG
jgi:hypothetical protein